MNRGLRDPVGLLLQAARVDPVLMRAARQVEAEIDRLQAWKQEAIAVLDEWEQVWIAAGQPGPLGASKASCVRRLIEEAVGR